MMGIAFLKRRRSLTPIHGVIVLLAVLVSHAGLMAAPVDGMTHTLLPFGGSRALHLTADMGDGADVARLDVPTTPRVAASDEAPPSLSASDCWLAAVPRSTGSVPCILASATLPPWMHPRLTTPSVDDRAFQPPGPVALNDPQALLQVFRN